MFRKINQTPHLVCNKINALNDLYTIVSKRSTLAKRKVIKKSKYRESSKTNPPNYGNSQSLTSIVSNFFHFKVNYKYHTREDFVQKNER